MTSSNRRRVNYLDRYPEDDRRAVLALYRKARSWANPAAAMQATRDMLALQVRDAVITFGYAGPRVRTIASRSMIAEHYTSLIYSRRAGNYRSTEHWTYG